MVEQKAGDRPGNRGGGQEPEHAALGLGEGPPLQDAAQARGGEPPPVSREGEGDRRERPQVKGHVEGQAVVFPAEQPGHHDQMARAADRKELPESLNQAEDERLQSRQRRSPPRLVCSGSR
jgi:hypothetical protein